MQLNDLLIDMVCILILSNQCGLQIANGNVTRILTVILLLLKKAFIISPFCTVDYWSISVRTTCRHSTALLFNTYFIIYKYIYI